ncbi:MAG: hypothetical protein M1820_009824 [Bogoriella megaspora]|nr:MAG: hypothetical protein M1820_009824 [Bogoriella megaspora]
MYQTPVSAHPSTRKRGRPDELSELDLHSIQSSVLERPGPAEEPSSASTLRFTPTQQRHSQSLDIPLELTPHGIPHSAHTQPLPLHYQRSHLLTPVQAPSYQHQHHQQQAASAQSRFQPVQTQAQAQAAAQQHHHHRLPNQPPPSKMQRQYGESSQMSPTSPTLMQHAHGPPSVVGQEGMPPPAPRPRGPKLKFTPEDDQLLVDLKEKKNLTWKQIADFFPGRSSGTLQVRYCTKLKAKTTVWTDDMHFVVAISQGHPFELAFRGVARQEIDLATTLPVTKLRQAMHEYDTDRWRIIAAKLGAGFSPAACREKAEELEAEVIAATDPEASTQAEASGYGP